MHCLVCDMEIEVGDTIVLRDGGFYHPWCSRVKVTSPLMPVGVDRKGHFVFEDEILKEENGDVETRNEHEGCTD
jgi:hypothetical protein